MRKLIMTGILICAAIAACAGIYAKNANVRVFVDNRKVKLDRPVMMKNGRAYIGLRSVAKALKATTKWDKKTKTAIVTIGNKRVRVAQSNGIISDGALFLPLRTTGEAMDCTVEWDNDERAIWITTEAPCPTGGG